MKIDLYKLPLFVMALFFLNLASGGAMAASPLDQLGDGIKIGEAIPTPLTATDQYGKIQEFRSLNGRRGLILLFTRSLDW